MEHREADGRYLVTRKVHWQAVYRVLVDEGRGNDAAGPDGGRWLTE